MNVVACLHLVPVAAEEAELPDFYTEPLCGAPYLFLGGGRAETPLLLCLLLEKCSLLKLKEIHGFFAALQ